MRPRLELSMRQEHKAGDKMFADYCVGSEEVLELENNGESSCSSIRQWKHFGPEARQNG